MTESQDNGEAPAKERKPPRDRVFAVDRRAWAAACDLGMPAAVSYLVLACGTGGDQRTTRWSVDAIERHTGIGRPRAKAAVEALIQNGLVRRDKGGSRPQYHMVAGHEVEAAKRPDLTQDEQRVLELITAGHHYVPKVGRHDNAWQYGNPFNVAVELARKGLVHHVEGRTFEPLPANASPPDDAPDWIWLPSSLVESEGGSATPVERIRQSQNVGALRLFIDLYHAHDLRDGHGIDWRGPNGLRGQFERHKVGPKTPCYNGYNGYKQETNDADL